MANTLKTLTGEIVVSEIEAIITDTVSNLPLGKNSSNIKVVAVGKTGVRYDLTSAMTAVAAAKVATATAVFVAGTGHTIFDPTQVK